MLNGTCIVVCVCVYSVLLLITSHSSSAVVFCLFMVVVVLVGVEFCLLLSFGALFVLVSGEGLYGSIGLVLVTLDRCSGGGSQFLK